MPETLENIAIIQSQYLIHQAQNGDQKAFGRLVDLWYKRIYNFSLKYFGDHDLAMESTQKTIIAVYENIGKLKDNQRFRYWIYKIALNQCRAEDRKRKQKPWHSIFHDKETLEVVSELHDPEQAYQQMEKEEIISNMLLSLPEDQRVLVIMKEFEGLKFREIADALGISESTAKSRLYYGLSRLKIMIEKSELNIR